MVEELKLVKNTKIRSVLPDTSPMVGRVVDVPQDGFLLVQCGDTKPLRARMVSDLAGKLGEPQLGQEVVLLFENNDPEKPIAIASLQPTGDFATALEAASRDKKVHARVDGETVLIKAEQKLELRVGKASIVIDNNGKITIRGANLLSRSTGPIRIKGGHVEIN
ncbi:MAG: phage baseplate assembly protein V [Xanthomonadales bacterium]|nr:phage baseplate assembly protein V [Xanthomonadales bacterium]MDH4020456.1 phage baseplate assembly protein V [Xanthomonadales bacterium]